jgi:hypothetical protein
MRLLIKVNKVKGLKQFFADSQLSIFFHVYRNERKKRNGLMIINHMTRINGFNIKQYLNNCHAKCNVFSGTKTSASNTGTPPPPEKLWFLGTGCLLIILYKLKPFSKGLLKVIMRGNGFFI